jgi:phosphoribosylanthranilate isomerase
MMRAFVFGYSVFRSAGFLRLARDMPHTAIKICGITRNDDALAVSASGADALGLVFYPASPRAVTVEQAVDIVSGISPFLSVVALFVDEPVESIERILSAVPINVIQFHGDETAEFCQQFGRPWIKAIRVKPGVNVTQACLRYSQARGVLLDTWQQGVPGGTGKTFDWNVLPEPLSSPLVLAGGLDEGNVADAIRRTRPAAVDVSGGVESAPGVKDAGKIDRFVAAVRAASH